MMKSMHEFYAIYSRKRLRRANRRKRRGRMPPAEATRVSVRTRATLPRTKAITRHHRLEWYWEDR